MKTKINLYLIAFVFVFMNVSLAQNATPGKDKKPASLQIFPVYQDISPPLRDMVPSIPSGKAKPEFNEEGDKERLYPFAEKAQPQGPDPVWQKQQGTWMPEKTPLLSIEGIPQLPYCGSPSDCNGAAGLDYYVQIVNSNYQVFDKAGNTILGPIYSNTIWQGLPGADDPGPDPVILWDDQAQRWFIGHMGTGGNYLLMAVSVTSDPTGSYYRYSWSWPALPDYPKFGIWRDGYYCSLQCSSWDICVFNRTAMLSGGSVNGWLIDNPITNSGGGLCTVDNDGAYAPSGSPGMFMTLNDDAWGGSDELWIYTMQVDWGSPGGVTFTRTQQLPVAAFDGNLGAFRQNIKQKNTTQKIDGIPMVLMFRCQYRNFGNYQSIVCCHTVDVDNTDHAGVRWYELRKTSGNWYVYQQGTYAPDAHSRWMGSIAQNQYGDIALGYSVSSSTMFPSIAFTGRRKTDALGTMTVNEQFIWNGVISQTTGDRWGDYSALSLDPADDKSFWYTTMYSNNTSGWRTRVASFSFGAHCIASGGCWKYIERVQAGTIDNTSDCNEYADYSSTLSTNVPLNGGVYVRVTNVGFVLNTDQCGVWVDWNRDRDFNDANETIAVPGSPGEGPYAVAVIPPAGATTGECTMRIRVTSGGTLSPCGVMETGEVEDYTLNLVASTTSNTWTGLKSTDWNAIENWSLLHTCLYTENVTIPGGTPYEPFISGGTTANCNNLTISGGGILTQTGTSYLYVFGNMNTDAGQYTSSGLAYLYFDGSANTTWDDDNANDVYQAVRINKDLSTAYVYMWQDMTVNNNFEIREGEFKIDATWTLTVNSTTTIAFEVESGGKLTLNDEHIDVAGRVTFFDGSQATLSGGSIRCGGDFRVESNAAYNIVFTGGSLIMDGSSTQYIHDLDGGTTDLYNLQIEKTGGTCYIGDSNLDILGSLTINSGSFSCTNAPSPTVTYNIYIGGNWTNNVGAANFNESTGKVIFNGANAAQIYTNETFYNLDLNKSSASPSVLVTSHNITITNDLHLYNGTFLLNLPAELKVGRYMLIEIGAGLNASSGSDVYVGSHWYNLNNTYSSTVGYNPGLHTIFNGTNDQFMHTNALYESFQNLVINKASGRFMPHENIVCFQDMLLESGIWEDSLTGLTHKFYRNFTVHPAGNFKTDTRNNTVYFGGESDAIINYESSAGYLYYLIIDKSFDKSGSPVESGDGKSYSLSLGSNVPVMGTDILVNAGDFYFNGYSLSTTADISVNSGGKISMSPGSGLKMSNGKFLRVNNGGNIELTGAVGNPVTITTDSPSQYLIFEIESGGTISAERAVFENMDPFGVNLKLGSMVNTSHAFSYCTFRNQPAGNAALMTINNNQNFTVYYANFPENTWGGSNNVKKNINQGHVLFEQASGLFSGSAFENDPYNRIDWTDAFISLSLTVMMEGPFSGGSMNTALNPSIPLVQPFNPVLPYFGNPLPGWYYEGTEAVMSVPSPNIVDWVLVELRDAPNAASATPGTMIARKAAFLMNDGIIVNLDGSSILHFNASVLQSLFVVLWHRNHLGVMSALPLTQWGGVYTYNFTSDASRVYGGATGHKQLAAGIWGMISGDGNADGVVSNTDKANVWQIQVGLSGYYAGDFNMNGQVDNSDKTIKWKPNSGAGSQVPDSMTPPGGYKSMIPE